PAGHDQHCGYDREASAGHGGDRVDDDRRSYGHVGCGLCPAFIPGPVRSIRMHESLPAKLLRLHFSEQDKYQGGSLYEAVVQKCRELSIAGATVFRGLEGYGESAEIHRHHLLLHDQPIVVMIVDSEENIRRLVPAIEQMMETGLIT